MSEAEERDIVIKAAPESETGSSYITFSPVIYGMEFFHKHRLRLRMDGHIDYKRDQGTVRIWRTPKGTIFLQDGGYSAIEEAKQEETRKQKSDRIWSKVNILAAIISALIAVIALLVSYNSSDNSQTEIRKLSQTVDSLKIKLNRVDSATRKK